MLTPQLVRRQVGLPQRTWGGEGSLGPLTLGRRVPCFPGCTSGIPSSPAGWQFREKLPARLQWVFCVTPCPPFPEFFVMVPGGLKLPLSSLGFLFLRKGGWGRVQSPGRGAFTVSGWVAAGCGGMWGGVSSPSTRFVTRPKAAERKGLGWWCSGKAGIL